MFYGTGTDNYRFDILGLEIQPYQHRYLYGRDESKTARLARELMERRELHLNFLSTLIKKVTGSTFKLSIVLMVTCGYHKYTKRIYQYIRSLKVVDEIWIADDCKDALDRALEPEGNLLEVEE